MLVLRSKVLLCLSSVLLGAIAAGVVALWPWVVLRVGMASDASIGEAAWEEPSGRVGVVEYFQPDQWPPWAIERADVFGGRLVLPPGDAGSGAVMAPTVIPQLLNGWATPFAVGKALPERPHWLDEWLTSEGEGRVSEGMRIESGWPLACLQGWVLTAGAQSGVGAFGQRRVGLVDLPSFMGGWPIPFQPLGLGVAVNVPVWSVLAGTLLWLVRALMVTVRSWMRRRRTLCTRCAHSRRGLPPNAACPECGQVEPR